MNYFVPFFLHKTGQISTSHLHITKYNAILSWNIKRIGLWPNCSIKEKEAQVLYLPNFTGMFNNLYSSITVYSGLVWIQLQPISVHLWDNTLLTWIVEYVLTFLLGKYATTAIQYLEIRKLFCFHNDLVI